MTEKDQLTELEALLNSNELKQALDRRKSQKQFTDLAGLLETAKIPSLIKDLEALQPVAELACPHVFSNDRRVIADNLDNIANLANLLETAETYDALAGIQPLLNPASKAAETTKSTLQLAWNRTVKDAFDPYEGLDTVLAVFNLPDRIRQNLKQVITRSKSLTQKFPPTATTLSQFQPLIAERDQLKADIAKETGNPEVADFLLALVQGQATLAALTPTILDSLKEHNALGRFAIQVAPSTPR